MKIVYSIALILIVSALPAQKQTQFIVNFDFDKYEITTASAARLDSFVYYILSRPITFTIELSGHCDSVGSNVYNDALSMKRSEAVKNYLAAKGLPSFTVVKEEGMGKRKPLNNNATDHDRFLNRRVVVDVTIPGRSVVSFPGRSSPGKPGEKTVTTFVRDTATKVGSRFVLKNLIFIGGRHFLVPESYPLLYELFKVMLERPKVVISIEGHVCCIPGSNDTIDRDLNTANLSEMRAKYVYEYLLAGGIDSSRLSYKGYGHKFPVSPFPEKNDKERDNNRRVEIKIISK